MKDRFVAKQTTVAGRTEWVVWDKDLEQIVRSFGIMRFSADREARKMNRGIVPSEKRRERRKKKP